MRACIPRTPRLALYLDDTLANQHTARRRLTELEKQLAAGTFAWPFWLPEGDTTTLTWNAAIRRLHHKKVVLGRTSESTWRLNSMGRLRQVPGTAAVTTTSMATALAKYDRAQCSYKERYHLPQQIAQISGVDFPEVPVPTYGRSSSSEVPSDAEIVDLVQNASPTSGWYYGMTATYGLRPHEVEVSTLLDGDRLHLPDGTKTGFRTVIPCTASGWSFSPS